MRGTFVHICISKLHIFSAVYEKYLELGFCFCSIFKRNDAKNFDCSSKVNIFHYKIHIFKKNICS